MQYTNTNSEEAQTKAPSVQRKQIAPGKQIRSGAVGRAAVQAKGGGGDNESVHAAAERGISGGAQSMPHADAIQQSFGRHDVGSVQAHVGGQATAACDDMSATAYATGTHVAFRDTPDLHTAAHEAAHVVQQRAGVNLSGGVGQAGDSYERNADAVADQVVRGESAETLLDGMAGGSSDSGGVQQKAVQKDGDDAPECRELGMFEALGLLAKVVWGSPLSEEERVNLQGYIEGLSNDQFAALVRASDSVGILQRLTRGIYGNEADPTGGDEQLEVPVLCYRFWNANDQIQADVDTANTIYGHHDVSILKVSERTISKEETEAVVGSEVDDDFKLQTDIEDGEGGARRFSHADMAAVVQAYVPTTLIAGLWAKRVVLEDGTDLAGISSPAFYFGSDYNRLAAVATDYSGADTFAHELGHILIDEGHTDDTLMETGSSRDKTQTGDDLLTDEQVESIKTTTLGWIREAGGGE